MNVRKITAAAKKSRLGFCIRTLHHFNDGTLKNYAKDLKSAFRELTLPWLRIIYQSVFTEINISDYISQKNLQNHLIEKASQFQIRSL
jgi:hypothetical protein